MKNAITLIKLGGSVITRKEKEYSARVDVIRQLVREIKKAKTPVVIAHGSGGFGHTSATKYGGKKGYKSTWGVAKVARDAMEINRIVMDILIEEKIPAVSMRPMSMIIAKKGKAEKNFFESIILLLKQGITPVVYGDVIVDTNWKTTIFSGETTLDLIGLYLLKNNFKIVKNIQVGITDGVYDENKKTIPEITKKNYRQYESSIFKSKNTDVTGGMKHKIESSLVLAEKKISTYIINGLVRNNLYKILVNKNIECTIIK
jgi:isopentenyl phosphate kinase